MLLHQDRVVREPNDDHFGLSFAATVGRRAPYSITLSMLLAFIAGVSLFAVSGKELARIGLLAGAIIGGTLPRFPGRS